MSQFTLYGDARRGRRPSFTDAMRARPAQGALRARLRATPRPRLTVGTGIFAADMKVALINDGPVTLLLDTPSCRGLPANRGHAAGAPSARTAGYATLHPRLGHRRAPRAAGPARGAQMTPSFPGGEAELLRELPPAIHPGLEARAREDHGEMGGPHACPPTRPRSRPPPGSAGPQRSVSLPSSRSSLPGRSRPAAHPPAERQSSPERLLWLRGRTCTAPRVEKTCLAGTAGKGSHTPQGTCQPQLAPGLDGRSPHAAPWRSRPYG